MTSVNSLARMTALFTEQLKAQPYGGKRRRKRARKPFFEVHGSSELGKYQRIEILEDVFVPAAHKQWGKGRRKDPQGRIYSLGCDRQVYGVKQCDAAAKAKEKGFVLYHLKTYKFHSWSSLKGSKYRRFRKEFKRQLKIVLARKSFKMVRTALAKLSVEKRAEFIYNNVFRTAAGIKAPAKPSTMGGLGGALGSSNAGVKLTRANHILIGNVLQKMLRKQRKLHGYKTLTTLVGALKSKKLRWDKKLNHPTHIKFLKHLNRVMPKGLKPSTRYPKGKAGAQRNQRVFASWLLYRFVDFVTKRIPTPKLTAEQVKAIGSALERTRRTHRRQIVHGSKVALTCALKSSLAMKSSRTAKWIWSRWPSKVRRNFVSQLDKKLPEKLKPKNRYPFSAAQRERYAQWLLGQYVRRTKLPVPPKPKLRLSSYQSRLYLKHALLPALKKAGYIRIRSGIAARRQIIWAGYSAYKMLPPPIMTKLMRFTSKILGWRAFRSIQRKINARKAKYCPSGAQQIIAEMFRKAVWNKAAIADARRAKKPGTVAVLPPAKKPSAMGDLGAAIGPKKPAAGKSARVETVPLNAKQKRLVLAAVLKAVNKWRAQKGKRRFRSAAQARNYLRKHELTWNRMRKDTLNSKLVIELTPLLMGTKLGTLRAQLRRLGRVKPEMLYHSAVFDTGVGKVTVVQRKLPSVGKPAVRPAVAVKPLKLSTKELKAAKGKLLNAWRNIRLVYGSLQNFKTSTDLAAYLKKNNNDPKLVHVKKDLILVFRNELNGKISPVPRRIRPKLKSRRDKKQLQFAQRVYLGVLAATKAASAMGGLGSAVGKPRPVAKRPVPRRVAPHPRPRPRPRPRPAGSAMGGLGAAVGKPRPVAKRPAPRPRPRPAGSAMGGLGAAIGGARPAPKRPAKYRKPLTFNQKQMDAGKRAMWLVTKRLFPADFRGARRSDAKVAKHFSGYIKRKGGWKGVSRWVKDTVRKALNKEYRLGNARPFRVHRRSAAKQRAYTKHLVNKILFGKVDIKPRKRTAVAKVRTTTKTRRKTRVKATRPTKPIKLSKRQTAAAKRGLWLAAKRVFPAYFRTAKRNDKKVATHFRTYIKRKGGWDTVPRWVKDVVRSYFNKQYKLGNARPFRVHRRSAARQRAYTGRLIKKIIGKKSAMGGLGSIISAAPQPKPAKPAPRASAMGGLDGAIVIPRRVPPTRPAPRSAAPRRSAMDGLSATLRMPKTHAMARPAPRPIEVQPAVAHTAPRPAVKLASAMAGLGGIVTAVAQPTVPAWKSLPIPPKGSKYAMSWNIAFVEAATLFRTIRNDGKTCEFKRQMSLRSRKGYKASGAVCQKAVKFDRKSAEEEAKFTRIVYKHMRDYLRLNKRRGKMRCKMTYRGIGGKALLKINGRNKAACRAAYLAGQASDMRNARMAYIRAQKARYLKGALKGQIFFQRSYSPGMLDMIWKRRLNADGTPKK